MSKYKIQRGLIKTINEADDTLGYLGGTWVQVNYDKATGEVWGDWMVGCEHKVYHDPNVITIPVKYAGKVTRARIIDDLEFELWDEAHQTI